MVISEYVPLPDDHPLQIAHEKCTNNLAALQVSHKAHCFYCLNDFSPSEIKEWIDSGLTALCPRCGIDSVLPIGAVPGETPEDRRRFLEDMEAKWFGELHKNAP